jgi:pantoate--beta-alanine ligase
VLKDSLFWIAEEIKAGNRDFVGLEEAAKARIVEAGFAIDYVTLCNSKTLDQVADDDLEITILGAMFTESARLIDNLSISL